MRSLVTNRYILTIFFAFPPLSPSAGYQLQVLLDRICNTMSNKHHEQQFTIATFPMRQYRLLPDNRKLQCDNLASALPPRTPCLDMFVKFCIAKCCLPQCHQPRDCTNYHFYPTFMKPCAYRSYSFSRADAPLGDLRSSDQSNANNQFLTRPNQKRLRYRSRNMNVRTTPRTAAKK